MTTNPLDIVLAFVEKINQHDVEGLCELMTDDHRFVDSLGSSIQGREEMRKAWIGYYYLIPDYEIIYSEIFQRENSVALFGIACGTYVVNGKLLKENRWEIPAAWRAVVRDDRIAEWQVYADNEPVRKIMTAHDH